MDTKTLFLFMLVGAAYLCVHQVTCDTSGVKSSEEKSIDGTKSHPSFHDDIQLTPEQQAQYKERGVYTFTKWPKAIDRVEVPYFFNTTSFPVGHPFRGKFKGAVDIYRKFTCIDWVEVQESYRYHKVMVYEAGGCFSRIGMTSDSVQGLSLGYGCDSNGTMLHEMAHTMGLLHTQSRPDRDTYVQLWLKNVLPGMEYNFDKYDFQTYQIPYDYKSIMHYNNDQFTKNGSFTLTPVNPYAIFYLGNRPQTFRHSDATFLNRMYDCVSDFKTKCGDLQCQNGGYTGKDCKCYCPENTIGTKCETLKGPYFAEYPSCGGDVYTEGDIMSKGYPKASTLDKCVFFIRAPKCYVPAITIKEAKFYWNDCYSNKLAIQVSPSVFGYTWCETSKVPFNKTIVSDYQVATIYYYTEKNNYPNLGFKANIRFVLNNECIVRTNNETESN